MRWGVLARVAVAGLLVGGLVLQWKLVSAQRAWRPSLSAGQAPRTGLSHVSGRGAQLERPAAIKHDEQLQARPMAKTQVDAHELTHTQARPAGTESQAAIEPTAEDQKEGQAKWKNHRKAEQRAERTADAKLAGALASDGEPEDNERLLRRKHPIVAQAEQTEEKIPDLLVATIGIPPAATCQPGLSSGRDAEWCIGPVYSKDFGKCGFGDWDALADHVRPMLDKAPRYAKQFKATGHVGAKQDGAKNGAIYAAHLKALRSLCARGRHSRTDLGFGVVLESDVAIPGRFRKWWSAGAGIIDVMRSHPEATVFNLGPTSPVCTNEKAQSQLPVRGRHSRTGQTSSARMSALKRGQCLVPSVLGVWGAAAVGYNLTSACSEAFLAAQDALIGCVPSDLGLYTSAGGFVALMATVPFFEVQTGGSSTHNKDGVHAVLERAYVDGEALWKDLDARGAGCGRARGEVGAAEFEDWRWRCKGKGWSSRLELLPTVDRGAALASMPSGQKASVLNEIRTDKTTTHRRGGAANGVILTSFFTYQKDPQRDIQDPLSYYIRNFYITTRFHQLQAVIFHDGIPSKFVDMYSTPLITFEKVNPDTSMSTNDFRFKAYQTYMKRTQHDWMLMVDASDVFFNSNPFQYMIAHEHGHKLFMSPHIGSIKSNPWMVKKMKTCYKTDVNSSTAVDQKLYNAGVWGGHQRVVECMVECVIKQLTGPIKGRDNCNMPAVNWCLWHGKCIIDSNHLDDAPIFVNPFQKECTKPHPVIHDKCSEDVRNCVDVVKGEMRLTQIRPASKRCKEADWLRSLDPKPKANNPPEAPQSPEEKAAVVSAMSPEVTDIYVVSLDGVPGAPAKNIGRLDSFHREWAEKCGAAVRINVCAGVMDKRRGFGITLGFMSCIDQALANTSAENSTDSRQRQARRQPTANDRAMVLIFEDDARLFDNDFCAPAYRAKLWSAAPKDTFLVMLGGHHWCAGPTRTVGPNGTHFQEVTHSYGAYGFAVPRQNLATLRSGFARLAESSADMISPDKDWYKYAKQEGQRIYALQPLAVSHPAGFSNTWSKHRDAIEERLIFPVDPARRMLRRRRCPQNVTKKTKAKKAKPKAKKAKEKTRPLIDGTTSTQPRKNIVHLHIDKSGGTSVSH